MLWVFAVVAGIVYLYLTRVKPLLYWKERGVKQPSLSHLFLISLPALVRVKLGTKSTILLKNELYNENSKERYVGRYDVLPNSFKNVLMIKDIDLIKLITVKKFEHFTDHQTFVPPGLDPIWDKNLFALKGQPWREMRSTLSPTFTGRKMRSVFTVVNKVAQQMIEFHLSQNKSLLKFEAKDFFTRFTNDVIATTAFGVEVDSFKNPENEFYLTGLEVTAIGNPSKTPKRSKNRVVFSEEDIEFFRNIVKQSIEYREKNNIERPDVLQLLINTKKNKLQYDENINTTQEGFSLHQEKTVKSKKLQITDDDVMAQAIIFFFAGFDTVSTLMSYAAYELALNTDVQQKLYEEIIETWKDSKGNLTYEIITEMTYMDMVISEALRKWPAASTTRECTKTFTIEPVNPGEKAFVVEAGSNIEIPIYEIHRDPKYYPEPDRFDPERFSKKNREKINPATYMPFGAGPRICIGNRLALLETKIAFFYLLLHFEIVTVRQTPIPIKFHPLALNLNILYPCPLGLHLRSKSVM